MGRIAGASHARFSLSARLAARDLPLQFNAYYNAVSSQNGVNGGNIATPAHSLLKD